MRVVVAMSGGVDSSVAAAQLVDAGHEVIGLSMQLYDQRQGTESFGSCCSLDDLHDARRVAAALGIPHYIVNFEEQFQATVVRNFVDEYARGRTPIPCVHCNATLKFAHLVERAAGLDAAAVATGHYARVRFDEDRRRYRLLRGADAAKDQSYFLFSLTQDQLSRAMFPVGHLTKPEVRAYAERLQLAVADKPDSHEICFVPDGKAGDFVERRLDRGEPLGGEIVDSSGAPVGRHRGLHRFTVGQRKGLGLSTPEPLYVLRLEPAQRRLVVGSKQELGGRELSASGVNWIAGLPPAGPCRVTARIRHRHTDAPATVVPAGTGRASLVFDEPQLAITPGQAVVFYDADDVVGGGWID
jgi:tRNA-specific 2-thiouridylase